MTVIDNTMQVDCLSNFFKHLVKISATVGKNFTKIVMKKPGSALEMR